MTTRNARRSRGGSPGSALSFPLFALFAALAFLTSTKPAQASGHFRFGTLSWAPNTQENSVDLTLQVAYKKNYVWGSDLESWKEDGSSSSAFKQLATASTEEQSACNAWDKSSARPDACTSLTISPEVGFVIKFPSKALPSEGQCSSPLKTSPTTDGCLPWTEVYGFYAGDGGNKDVEITITDSTSDVYSPLANYIIGKSVFTHTYASAENGGEAWTAYFTGGDRDPSLLNNAGGRFRLETTVKISGTNRSPIASVIPIIPVPKSATAAQFQIMGYDLNALTTTPTVRDGGEREYGGVYNYKGATTLTNANSPGKTSGIAVATSTGILTFTTETKASGLYNQVVMVETTAAKIPVDFTMYVYDPVSFCHADCVASTGLATFADADGVYDQCTICGNGVTSDYTLCTPVFQSAGCPEEGDTFSGVKPSADACQANQAPKFVSPTPGIDSEGAASPAYPGRATITAFSGSDVTFEIHAEDLDSCSELEIVLVNPPDNTALLNKSNYTGGSGKPATKATFVWPAPSIEASEDKRPATSVVCFYAFDKYAASLAPYLHCVDITIQAGPIVNEQVLARFGCHMGLLWSPPVLEGATKGRFCFFDKSADYANGLTFNKYCSAADYETAMWHNAYVSIDECGLDTCPGKLYVDGAQVKEFTTSWGAQDCTRPLDIQTANGTYSEVQDAKDTSVCPEGDCASCASSMRIGAGCMNKHNTFSHFDGYVDEFVLYNTTVSQNQVSRQLFHLPGHMPIDTFVVGAASEDIHEGVLAWYRFNDGCSAAVETKTSEPAARRRQLMEASFSSKLMSYSKYQMRDEWHNKYDGAAYAAGDLATPFKYVGAPWQTPTLTAQGITTTVGSSQLSLEAIGVAKSPFLSCIALNKDNGHVRPKNMPAQDLALADTFTNEYTYYSMSYQASSATGSLVGDGTSGFVNCELPAVPIGRYSIGVSNNMGLSSGVTIFGNVEDKTMQVSGGYLELGTGVGGEYTVSAWIKPASSPNKQYIFTLVDGSQIDTAIYVENGILRGLKDKFPMPDSAKNYADGKWHHIVLTTIFEGLTKTGARVYVDGEVASDLTGGASGGSSKVFTKMLVGGVPTNFHSSPGVTLEIDELMYTNTSIEALAVSNPNILNTIDYSLPVDYAFKAEAYPWVREYISLNSNDFKNSVSSSQTVLSFIGGTPAFASYVTPWNPPSVLSVAPASGPIAGGTTVTVTSRKLPEGDLVCVFYGQKTESNATYTGSQRIDGKVPSMTVAFENPASGEAVSSDATKLSSMTVTCTTPAQLEPKTVSVAVVPKIGGTSPDYSAFYVSESKDFTYELDVIKCEGPSSVIAYDLSNLTVPFSTFGYTMEAWVQPSGTSGTLSGTEGIDGIWFGDGISGTSGTVVAVEREGSVLSSIVYENGVFAYRDSGILTATSSVSAQPSDASPLGWSYVKLVVDTDGQGTLSVNETTVSTFTTTSRPATNAALKACGHSGESTHFHSHPHFHHQPPFTGLIHGLKLENVEVSPVDTSVEYIEETPSYSDPVTTAEVCASADALVRNLTTSLVFASRTGAYDASAVGDAVDRNGVLGLASNLPLSFPTSFAKMLPSGSGSLVFWAKLPQAETGYEMFAYTSSGKAFRGPLEITATDPELASLLSTVFSSGLGNLTTGIMDDIYLFSKELDLCEVQGLFSGNMYSLRMEGNGDSTTLTANVSKDVFSKPFVISMLVWPEEEGKNYELLSSDAISIRFSLGHLSVIIQETEKCVCEPCSDVREVVSSVPTVAGKWSLFEVSYDGSRLSLYLNGNEMDFANFGSEDFPQPGNGKISLFPNFKGYVHSLRIENGTKDYHGSYLCPLKPTGTALHYFNFDFPFLGTTVTDLVAEGASVSLDPSSGAPLVAPTRVVSESPDPSLTAVEGDFATTSGTSACFRIEAYTSCGRHFLGPMAGTFGVTFGSLDVQTTSLRDLESGVYEVCYTSTVCGTFDYNIVYNAAVVKTGQVTVAAGPVHPSNTVIEVPSLCANVKQDIIVTAKDVHGCVVPRSDLGIDVGFIGPSDPSVVVTHAPDISPGSYRASYTPAAEGGYQVTVKIGGDIAGAVSCTTHCVGHSLQLDGYGGVEFAEMNSMYSPLDLADTSFTMAAWVRRGPYGTKPAVTTAEEEEALGRALLQVTTTEAPSALSHYIFFKGDDADLGSDIKGYFLAFSDDWTTLTAGVYVQNEISITQRGEYRVVTTNEGLGLMTKPHDIASDDGWTHVAAVYTGDAFELYVGGLRRTLTSFSDKRFGQANADSRPLLMGLNFPGQIDEALLTQKALTGEEILQMMYCPMTATDLGIEVAAYIPFNEGGSHTNATLFRGIGAASVGTFDAPGHTGRTTFGQSRPGSKVGLTSSSALSYLSDTTIDAKANSEISIDMYMRDECGFAYLTDETINMQGYISTFEYNNFRSEVALFSDDRKLELSSSMAGVAYKHYKSMAPGSCSAATHHTGSFALTAQGSYTTEFKVVTQPIPNLVMVSLGAADVHISAEANFSMSISDISGSNLVDVGKDGFLLVTLRDSFGNIFDEGGLVVTLTSIAGEGFFPSPEGGLYLGEGVYKAQYHTTSAAPLGGYLIKARVDSLDLDASFQLNTVSPLPLELMAIGGPEALYGSTSAVSEGENSVYLFGGAKTNGEYSDTLWKLSYDNEDFYHKYLTLGLGDTSGDVAVIQVDTSALAEIPPDCAGVAFVSQSGDLLAHYLDPYPGCKNQNTKFYVANATKTTYMYYDSAAGPRSTTAVFGGQVDDFTSGFSDHSFEGEASLYLAPGSADYSKGGLTLGPKFTVQAAFYDALGTGTQVLTVTFASGATVTVGTDEAFSGSYVVMSSVTEFNEGRWTNRARGWHTLSIVGDGSFVYGIVDGSTRTLGAASDFVATAVSLSASSAAGPVLWDQLVLTSKTVVPSSVTGNLAYTNGAYLEGMKWHQIHGQGSPPHTLLGQQVVSRNGKLYVFGGERSGYISGEVYVFDTATGVWTYSDPKGPQPSPRMDYSGCEYEDVLYIFGGKSETGDVLSDLWIFDLGAEAWVEETAKAYVVDTGLYATGQLGGGHSHSCSVLNDTMVLFGGLMKPTQTASNSIAVLDLKTYQWTSGNIGPAARLSHAAVEDGASVFVFGGVNEKYTEMLDAWEYNLEKNRWRQLAYKTSIPSARVYKSGGGTTTQGGILDHSAVYVKRKMIAFGGLSYGTSQSAILALPLYNIN